MWPRHRNTGAQDRSLDFFLFLQNGNVLTYYLNTICGGGGGSHVLNAQQILDFSIRTSTSCVDKYVQLQPVLSIGYHRGLR